MIKTGLSTLFRKEKEREAANDVKFNSYVNSDAVESLLDNPTDGMLKMPKLDQTLFTSKNKGKRNKIMEGMMEIFNARKNQILERKAQPGITQTRLDYQ